ncbi:metal ABC transporter ATP-binding protein [Deferribacter thermophilus]|uniref:metal ABC transporter ATP-binding protein n=1 Tax=Deferribacter thermophilus TaxID=53573 RepID=UPI003C181165
MNSHNVLEIKDLNVAFGNKVVLENINLFLHNKEIMAIVGPNGGGKTTLLKTILGIYKPIKGEIKILGNKYKKLPKGLVGYLPQKDLINYNFPVLVKDVVFMGRKILKSFPYILNDQDREICFDALKRVNMEHLINTSFSNLSGGQKQRVLIARVLAMQPKILMFDEPATGLDVVGQEDFYELINKLREEDNITILMVTHDIGVISKYVDTVACLNKKIHFHGSPLDGKLSEVLDKVFGKNMQFIVHDSKCLTCMGHHTHE